MDFRGSLLGFLVFLALAGTGFCSSGAEQVEEGVCETFCVAQASISILVFLLVIAAAVIYAGGQILGAHMRSRAAVWATSMIVGALIGLIIYIAIPPVMGAMLLPEDSPEIGSVCACGGSGSAPGPVVPPEEDDDDEGGEEDDGDDADDETSPGGGGGGGGEEDDEDGGDEGGDDGGADNNDTEYGDGPGEDDEPIPDEPPEEAECSSHSDCAAGGTCSFQCMDADEAGDLQEQCPGVSESVCYSYTSCGCYDGACGWEQTPEFLECLSDPPDLRNETECIIDSDCARAGCSSELCVSAEDAAGTVSTCDYKDWYNCLPLSSCGCNAGKCAWDQNEEYLECLEDPPPSGGMYECIVDADCAITGCLSDSGTCIPADMKDEIEVNCEYWGGLIEPGEVCGCNGGTCGWTTMPRGECIIDSDCARAGCSSELCVAADEAGDIVTPCEYKDWHACLQYTSCGCNAGKCAWEQNEEYFECLDLVEVVFE